LFALALCSPSLFVPDDELLVFPLLLLTGGLLVDPLFPFPESLLAATTFAGPFSLLTFKMLLLPPEETIALLPSVPASDALPLSGTSAPVAEL
jgi:hypothetical protein